MCDPWGGYAMAHENVPLRDPTLPAKLVRPRLQSVYSRTRLFDVLAQYNDSRAFWVCGPAGSGKTTLVNSYLHSKKTRCIWYELDESDADVASFFYHLGHAASANSNDGPVDFPLLTPEFFPNIPVFTRRFFEKLCAEIPAPCAIVLDNYQEVREETLLHEVLCTAIDTLVPGFAIYVCSRREPPAELARPRANCAMHLLAWKHLQLDADEACGVASRVVGADYPKSVIEQLHAKTDGWMAGLLLLLRRGEFEDVEPHLLASHTPSEIFDYFGSVLFNRFDPDIQDILLRLSNLPRISKETAEKLAGERAMDVLSGLQRRNAFTYRAYTEDPIYYFHPLFRDFLQNQCNERMIPEELREVQAASAAALASEGRFDEAIRLYLRTSQIQEAVGLILSQAPGLTMQGRFQTLAEWIDALPGGIAQTMPWLVFWKGVCMVPYGPREGRPYFEKALAEFEAQGDPIGSHLALSGMIDSICFEANNYAELDSYINKYYEFHERWGEIQSPEVLLRVTNSMLMALVVRRSDSQDLPVFVEKAWQLFKVFRDVHVTVQLFIAIITLQSITGNFAGSQSVLDAFNNAIPEKGPPMPHLFHMNLRAFHCWCVGRFEEGLESAERGLAIEAESGIRLLYSALRTHAACAAIGLGNLDLAKRYFEEAASMVQYEGIWVQALYHAMRSWYELLVGNLAGACFHVEVCYEKSIAAGCPLNMPLTHSALATIRYEEGRIEEARQHIAAGFEASRRFEPPLFAFVGNLLKARMALDAGEGELADAALREGFRCGAQWNYRYFNHWQPRVMARLCTEALKRGIETQYVRSLVTQHGLMPESPPLDVPDWPWPVKLRTLGGFALEVAGEPVVFPRKAQQRPLSLLKFLAARGGKGVSDTDIQDALWYDADGDAAKNAYTTALHRVRKLLGNEKALVHAEGALSFNANMVWADVPAFETCCRQVESVVTGRHTPQDLQSGLESLLGLYCGMFLPGEQASWAIPTRERLQSRFLLVIQLLGRALERHDCLNVSETCYRHGLQADPLVESFYLNLMRILARQERKREALQLFEQCRSLLESELGVAPSSALVRARDALLGS